MDDNRKYIINMDGTHIFCPICGQLAPLHHKSVQHDWKSKEMQAYDDKVKCGIIWSLTHDVYLQSVLNKYSCGVIETEGENNG